MKKNNLTRLNNSDTLLDAINIELLREFKKYNSNGHNLFCSYMSAGDKYAKELLVIGREPSYWWEHFSVEELSLNGPEKIFNTKVRYYSNDKLDSSYPLSLIADRNDPFWGCVKEIVLRLGICKNDKIWSSYIALTYLYKITYCSKLYLLEKLRRTQFEYCKEMFQLELLKLKPKRVLFLTGMKYAKDFLDLPDSSGLENSVCNLGKFDYGFHKAQTVVSVNPKKYKRKDLVNSILKAF